MKVNKNVITAEEGLPTEASSYKWFKIQGPKGTTGATGAKGVNAYTHIKYSANSTGSGMVDTPSSATIYMGVYSGTSSTAPTSTSSYKWFKTQGPKGTTGATGATGPAGRGVKWTSMFGVPVTADSTTINGKIKPVYIETDVIYAEGIITAAAFYESSDKRLKENIKILSKGDVNLYEFNLKSDKDKKKHYGVIAQEIQETHPELIRKSKNDMSSVNYIDLLVLENVKLREENDAIKKRLDKIEALLNK